MGIKTLTAAAATVSTTTTAVAALLTTTYEEVSTESRDFLWVGGSQYTIATLLTVTITAAYCTVRHEHTNGS